MINLFHFTKQLKSEYCLSSLLKVVECNGVPQKKSYLCRD